MIKIVRTGNVVQKFGKNGKLIEGGSFKSIDAAKEIERKLKLGVKKHVTRKG